jgi:hypothetical protein
MQTVAHNNNPPPFPHSLAQECLNHTDNSYGPLSAMGCASAFCATTSASPAPAHLTMTLAGFVAWQHIDALRILI